MAEHDELQQGKTTLKKILLDLEELVLGNAGVDPFLIIFPERPKDSKRLKLIEHLFDERGIPVVWEDESIDERKVRS